MRNIIDFTGSWLFSKPGEPQKSVDLPHTWNAMDGQDGGNDYWRGTAVYEKSFPRPALEPGGRAVLEFLGAAMTADVTLNGVHLAHHEGGYSTFLVDITDALRDENALTVAVDNSENDRVYPQKADFTFYGGLYRGVNLITVPAEHFELVKDGTPGIKVTPALSDDLKVATVTVETWHNGSEVAITLNSETKTVQNTAVFTVENPHLWDGTENPYLYTVTAKLQSGDEVSTRFGIRKIGFDPNLGFILNNRPYPLRGVSRHQDREGLGNALTMKEHLEDMELIREIGANTIRLAHYQHAQEFYDLCDEYGLCVWAEIPYITQHMDAGRESTLSQMCELITQCYNHPCVVCWGLSNEIAVHGMSEDLMENHRLLNDLCHKLDSTRPTTMAHAFMLDKDSPLIDIADIGSWNLYFGWYLGELSQNDSFLDEYHAVHPDRVIGFSEYGADANPRFQSPRPESGDYTESYQCVYHEHLLRCIEARPWLWATHVWNMFDFAADGRDEGGKNGQNQKGLVTFDRKLKKDAFYLYKAAWNKHEPFVHICGSRYADRAESVTEVKVYSNLSPVTLFVDGKELDTKDGKTVFTFKVPLTGEHVIEAKTGEYADRITVRKVAEFNPDYSFSRKGPVTNWFDEADFDSSCYSIRDTMGTLMQNPQAAAIVGEIMAKAHASRGEVAQSASRNPALQKMMAGMSFEGILKKAGENVIPAAIVREINEKLQKIRK